MFSLQFETDTLSHLLVCTRAELAMAIKPNVCPLTFSPSNTVSFSGSSSRSRLMPSSWLQVPPTFSLSAHCITVEYLRVCILTLVDSSWCHGLEMREGRLSEAPVSSPPHSAFLGAAWPLLGACAGFLVWR